MNISLMECPKCNQGVSKTDKICDSCGYPLVPETKKQKELQCLYENVKISLKENRLDEALKYIDSCLEYESDATLYLQSLRELTLKKIDRNVYSNKKISNHLKNGFIKTESNGLFGLINESGVQVLPYLYDMVKIKSNYIFVEVDKKCGLFNLKGEEIVPCIYEEITIPNILDSEQSSKDNHIDYFQTKINGLYGAVSNKGAAVVPNKYNKIYFYKNQIKVLDKNRLAAYYINEQTNPFGGFPPIRYDDKFALLAGEILIIISILFLIALLFITIHPLLKNCIVIIIGGCIPLIIKETNWN